MTFDVLSGKTRLVTFNAPSVPNAITIAADYNVMGGGCALYDNATGELIIDEITRNNFVEKIEEWTANRDNEEAAPIPELD